VFSSGATPLRSHLRILNCSEGVTWSRIGNEDALLLPTTSAQPQLFASSRWFVLSSSSLNYILSLSFQVTDGTNHLIQQQRLGQLALQQCTLGLQGLLKYPNSPPSLTGCSSNASQVLILNYRLAGPPISGSGRLWRRYWRMTWMPRYVDLMQQGFWLKTASRCLPYTIGWTSQQDYRPELCLSLKLYDTW